METNHQVHASNHQASGRLAAIILAAGMSRRMGQPKMLLPWGKKTVLEQVITTLATSGIEELIIVTGAARQAVEAEAARLGQRWPIQTIFNPQYETGEMMSSIRLGLAALGPHINATLIAPGDQPQLSLQAAQNIVSAWKTSGARLIVPSFERRRGHPWVIGRDLWSKLSEANTARAFLSAHADEIQYVECDATVLQDLDTPEEYAQGLKNI
ncbi:MAG: hypothetical protein DDG60_05225 [Anaerolineae bacterium]|nr:MAG: hypothetical protein DDG60_05225 [Anaerolineae bacterium]